MIQVASSLMGIGGRTDICLLSPETGGHAAVWALIVVTVRAFGALIVTIVTVGALRKFGALRALGKLRAFGALIVTIVTVGPLRTLREFGALRTFREFGALIVITRTWRTRRMGRTPTWLAAVAEAGGEFLEGNAPVVIRIHSCEYGGYALSIPACKRRQGRKFVDIKTAVLTCDFRKLFLALGFKGGAAGITGGFLLLSGEFAIAIGIEFRDVCSAAFGPGGTACFFGSLTLLFVNLTVFVEVKLLKNFGEFAVTKGPVAVGIG